MQPTATSQGAGPLLRQLFDVASAEDFLARYWPDVPLVHDGDPARLTGLVEAPALSSIPAFLRAAPGPAWLHLRLPDGSYHHDASVGTEAAAALLRTGLMMDLRDVQRWLAPVQVWSQRLVSELQLDFARHASYCHAFVCPAGSGVPKHFDNREVIVVQLHGSKRWRIAQNHALPHPLMPHVVGGPIHALNQCVPPEILQDPEMPPETMTCVLAPGSVLFLPRGHWHQTHALSDSLSLSFGFRVPTWGEMFVNTALKELAKDPRWRAPSFDCAVGHPEGLDAFTSALREAIDTLLRCPPPTRGP